MRKVSKILKTKSPNGKLQKDWDRQLKTAEAIIDRHCEGFGTVLLADEVGMGKTYVAMAVMAHHVFQNAKNDRKVLLVVPPNSVLARKWEQEIRTFNGKYLNNTNVQKELRPMVVNNYWDLMKNLHDYDDFNIKRVSANSKECFAFSLWKWNDTRRQRRKWRKEWNVYGDKYAHDINYLDFCSKYSPKALYSYFDERSSNEPVKFESMIRRLNEGEPRDDYLNQLFREFAAKQDAFESNVYVMGMGALRKPRSNQKDSQLFSTYIVSLALRGCHKQTRQAVLEALTLNNFCFIPDAMMENEDTHYQWFVDLGSIDLWGMRTIAEKVLVGSPLVGELMDRGGIDTLRALKDRVIQEKLSESGIGLAVVDEVHNWKNGNNGADTFEKIFASKIKRKLIMSATPFQLHQDELGRVFRYASTLGDASLETVKSLFCDNGIAQKCLESSKNFLTQWNSITPADLGFLEQSLELGHSLDVNIQLILDSMDTSYDLKQLLRCVSIYRRAIEDLKIELTKVMIRHTKPRDKRHFHAGMEFKRNGPPNYQQIRRILYNVSGQGDMDSALINFMAMRVDQLVRRDINNKGYETNAHLLGGLTSSIGAFRKSNGKVLTNNKVTESTRNYLNFFDKSLDKVKHPKVSATVDRALSNYKAGMKTLIFCERLPTQKEIIVELTKRIHGEVFPAGGIEKVESERKSLLREHETVELYWSRSYLNGFDDFQNGLELIQKRTDKLLLKASEFQRDLGDLNDRQALKLLDLVILDHLLSVRGDGQEPLKCFSRLLNSDQSLRKYLRFKVDTEVTVDDEPEARHSTSEFQSKDISTILNCPNIFHAAAEHAKFHEQLWLLLKSEFLMLSNIEDSSDQTVVANLLIELGQGLRKVILRLDALKEVQCQKSESRALATVRMLKNTATRLHTSPWARAVHFLDVLNEADGSIRRSNTQSSFRQSFWKGVHLLDNSIVNQLNGSVGKEARISRCAAFNSPLLPDVLVCTAIGSEGIDLHLHCDEIIHHDLPWNPAKLEQRTGRIDRVGSLAERLYQPEKPNHRRLNIGIPFLAHNYETFQYELLLSRAQKFEILLGKPEFPVDIEDEDIVAEDGTEVSVKEVEATGLETICPVSPCLPTPIVEYLTMDLSVT